MTLEQSTGANAQTERALRAGTSTGHRPLRTLGRVGPAGAAPAADTDRSWPDDDPRHGVTQWRGLGAWRRTERLLLLLVPVDIVLAFWYLEWLLRPQRVGNPALFGLLVAAELFNVTQAVGFWWTCRRGRDRPAAPRWRGAPPRVDVLVPVYDEPLEVVGPTVAAAARMLGARVTVWLCDDAGRPELRRMADELGARYLRREESGGAKAGNLNHALRLTDAPFVAVFDCDHVPDRRFLLHTLGWLQADRAAAFVQTPQYYANARSSRIAAAAWSQQSLFFGAIARGKDAIGAMICCGTNVVFRRQALDAVGGFPTRTLTEDFELSIRLHELGYKSVYANEVLAQGLGPEDMTSYVSQQQRWARGCLAAIPVAIAATLPWRVRLQYLLSSMFFLSGWTFAVYMTLPVARIFFGVQPLAGATAAQFLMHFAPYFCMCLATVAVAGAGSYTFDAFSFVVATAWVQIASTVLVLLRRTGRFVVTAKRGTARAQPRAVLPSLCAAAVLAAAGVFAFTGRLSSSTLNNVAFAALHFSVLLVGCWAAMAGARRLRTGRGRTGKVGTEKVGTGELRTGQLRAGELHTGQLRAGETLEPAPSDRRDPG